tara:strand:+ start:403456 stop:403560 length:105 start_codon:yes stop_codon:yes gene_type:complete
MEVLFDQQQIWRSFSRLQRRNPAMQSQYRDIWRN